MPQTSATVLRSILESSKLKSHSNPSSGPWESSIGPSDIIWSSYESP